MSESTHKRLTLEDVARHAGVSRATASLVVRGSNLVSTTTRKKVLASIETLGYVYDRVAASFRSGHSSTVGVIITNIGNPFFPELLASIQDRLDEQGYTVLLGMSFESATRQNRVLETMLENRVCGIIMAPVAATAAKTFQMLHQLNIPCVLIGREIAGTNSDYIGTDFRLGTQLATRHLFEQGHRNIAFLGGVPETSAYQLRLEGYYDVLREQDIRPNPAWVFPAMPSREGGVSALNQLLTLSPRPTAAVCHNDIVALGAIAGLNSVGLNAGSDLALVGFDDIQEARTANPALSTVSIGVTHWGVHAAQLLHRRITDLREGNVTEALAEKIIVPPMLIVRKSSPPLSC